MNDTPEQPRWYDVELDDGKVFIVEVLPEDQDTFWSSFMPDNDLAFMTIHHLVSSAATADMYPGQDTIEIYVRPDAVSYIMPRLDNPVVKAKMLIARERDMIAQYATAGVHIPAGASPGVQPQASAGTPMTAEERERLLSTGGVLSQEDLARIIASARNITKN